MKKTDHLQKSVDHLGICLSELSKVLGSRHSYLGDIKDFKELVRVKVKLDTIVAKSRHLRDKLAMEKPAQRILSKEKINTCLMAMLGRDTLVEAWWHSPNRAFGMNRPENVYIVNPKEVSDYIMKQVSGDYS